jgi:hypothetical protein
MNPEQTPTQRVDIFARELGVELASNRRNATIQCERIHDLIESKLKPLATEMERVQMENAASETCVVCKQKWSPSLVESSHCIFCIANGYKTQVGLITAELELSSNRCDDLRRQLDSEKLAYANRLDSLVREYAPKIAELNQQFDEFVLKLAAKPTWDDVNAEIRRCNQVLAEKQELKRENAELRKDKERLDWLEKSAAVVLHVKEGLWTIQLQDEYIVRGECPATIRQAIDAAKGV